MAKRKQVKNACVNCQRACKKCDDNRPCDRCVKYSLEETCIDSSRKERRRGIKRGPYNRGKRRQRRDRDEALTDEEDSVDEMDLMDESELGNDEEQEPTPPSSSKRGSSTGMEMNSGFQTSESDSPWRPLSVNSNAMPVIRMSMPRSGPATPHAPAPTRDYGNVTNTLENAIIAAKRLAPSSVQVEIQRPKRLATNRIPGYREARHGTLNNSSIFDRQLDTIPPKDSDIRVLAQVCATAYHDLLESEEALAPTLIAANRTSLSGHAPPLVVFEPQSAEPFAPVTFPRSHFLEALDTIRATSSYLLTPPETPEPNDSMRVNLIAKTSSEILPSNKMSLATMMSGPLPNYISSTPTTPDISTTSIYRSNN